MQKKEETRDCLIQTSHMLSTEGIVTQKLGSITTPTVV